MNEKVILKIRDLNKSFPGVKALNNIDLDIFEGEVLGILGENGAGKSTLIKIISGVYVSDSGEIYLDGKLCDFKSAHDAIANGIRVMHQEVTILEALSVAENIFIGEMKGSSNSRVINWKEIYKEAKNIFDRLNIDINPRAIADELTIAKKKMVEIGRAIHRKAKIIIMDEPTASFGEEEIKSLFSVIRELRQQNITVIFITHKIGEIFQIADRVVVMRDGKIAGIKNVSETTENELVNIMVGRKITDMYPKRKIPIGEIVLKVSDFSYKNIFKDVSFDLRRGEVLGLFGLLGSGITSLVRAIFGDFPTAKGMLKIKDEFVKVHNPIIAKKNSMGMIPLDRRSEGLFLDMDVKSNIIAANIDNIGGSVFLDRRIEKSEALKWISYFNIKAPSYDSEVRNLSGGNQQKVIIARWLESGSEIIILNEPTFGIDVGAKVEIYKLIEDLCEQGKSFILISSDIKEIMGIADRIIVMSNGRIVAECPQKEADSEKLMKWATG